MTPTHLAPLRRGLLQREAAAEIGVTPRTMQRWAGQRIGPQPHRDGTTVLYDPTEVAAFIQARLQHLD